MSNIPVNQYVIRDVSLGVREAISQKFVGKKLSGHTSPRQSWLRSLINVGALDTERSIQVYKLWQRSLQIAAQRGDAMLKGENAVKERYEQEYAEFQAVLHRYRQQSCLFSDVANRLSSLLYYLVQIYSLEGNIAAFERACEQVCSEAGIPQDIAFDLADKKFESRGKRASLNLPKDVHEEYRGMQLVLDQFLQDNKIRVVNP